MVRDLTPVIVGVGQFTERLNETDYEGLSPSDIAAKAALAAIEDAGSSADILNRIDTVGGIRTFEDSSPRMKSPFGKADKYPRAVCKRLGINPDTALLEKAGGQSPLVLISKLGDRIAAGEAEIALAFGSEAISTVRHLLGIGEKRDWHEELEGDVEDEGPGIEDMMNPQHFLHGLRSAPASYALLENARRARLGLSREEYAQKMGQLFEPFSKIAAENPLASSDVKKNTAEQLISVDEKNRMIADPYMRKLVSRDQVNQGAAVLIMSVSAARDLGVPESKWIYMHGAAWASEKDILERPDMGASKAIELTLKSALATAGKSAQEIDYFDFYSCFPIPVFIAAIDVLGLDPADERNLTVTGGLPFFGGAGNNYSMHAIAEMTARLREKPGSFGLVSVNGGYISKYGACVLSTTPCEWRPCEHDAIQLTLDEIASAPVTNTLQGSGKVETYTITYSKGQPAQAIIVGSLDTGERFLANNVDDQVLEAVVKHDPIGERIYVATHPKGNRFAFDKISLAAALPELTHEDVS